MGTNTFSKSSERAISTAIRRFLGLFPRQKQTITPGIDFNRCKFLFIRQDRIGDVLVSSPLFELLKSSFPHASLDVLLSPKNEFVLAHNPFINRRWVYRKNLIHAFTLLFELRSQQYDFVIDLMDNPSTTSTLICHLSGARWRVGLEKENSFAYDIVVPCPSRRDTHIVDRLARLLTPFGIDPERHQLSLRFYLPQETEESVNASLRTRGWDKHTLVAINISAGHETRFWGVAKYRRLLALLQSAYPSFRFMILCKQEDHPRAQEIASGYVNAHVPPATSFDEFAAYIRHSHFLVTPDTSATHLAAGFGVPSVVLYVQSDKSLRIWEPYGTISEALIADVDDLGVIPPEDVLNAFRRITERAAGRTTQKAPNMAAP